MIRLLVLLILGAVGFWVFREIRRRPGAVPAEWRALAEGSPRLQEALAHRARLRRALGRRPNAGQTLAREVDALIASMVELARHDPDDRRLVDAASQVAAAADEAEALVADDPHLDEARDRLAARTERLRASVRGYAEVRQEDER